MLLTALILDSGSTFIQSNRSDILINSVETPSCQEPGGPEVNTNMDGWTMPAILPLPPSTQKLHPKNVRKSEWGGRGTGSSLAKLISLPSLEFYLPLQ